MSNCLISKIGKRIDCTGGVHDILCRQQLGMKLSTFMKRGGIRVKIRHDTAAVEFYGYISAKQNRIINDLLKQQPIYVIVLPYKTITRYRPIKSFIFENNLIK